MWSCGFYCFIVFAYSQCVLEWSHSTDNWILYLVIMYLVLCSILIVVAILLMGVAPTDFGPVQQMKCCFYVDSVVQHDRMERLVIAGHALYYCIFAALILNISLGGTVHRSLISSCWLSSLRQTASMSGCVFK